MTRIEKLKDDLREEERRFLKDSHAEALRQIKAEAEALMHKPNSSLNYHLEGAAMFDLYQLICHKIAKSADLGLNSDPAELGEAMAEICTTQLFEALSRGAMHECPWYAIFDIGSPLDPGSEGKLRKSDFGTAFMKRFEIDAETLHDQMQQAVQEAEENLRQEALSLDARKETEEPATFSMESQFTTGPFTVVDGKVYRIRKIAAMRGNRRKLPAPSAQCKDGRQES
jgi:hypothetical protein